MRAGRAIEAWTLEWDEDQGSLRKMRSKETEADYRYFREPDLLPIRLDEGWRDEILRALPELPLRRRARFAEQYGLPAYDAEILTEERSLSDFFEAAVRAGGEPKSVSNWLMNDVLRLIRERGVSAGQLRLRPEHLSGIIHLVESRSITAATGKDLLAKVEESGRAPDEIVAAEGLAVVGDEQALGRVAAEVIAENPAQVASYQAGKTTLLGWFVGQVMRKTGGKADPQPTRAILEDLLSRLG
jgi:aspartyl-tRNA(Asn)/glutamyl-tRNA(Gln) amidotransferase subunit B